ncbi:GGDEF domain-containing protein [Teredinibacter sp. KSP-S5-2]|uniref:GGDEF domain-containing protein n=1 Tax=Teredinibacter sp. KSP-S5-2 TaxID=3034506 RepID=UPI002934F433|nr:GGDEF domain-containing protein [Teredinibacter sp. KSP-S5-2]WNO07727.1 GGDEF domain-containing protein [Teredinibacter sp. KSP-S5-2]
MVTLASSRNEADIKRMQEHRVNGFPGENELKDLQFKLANNLQSTLDIQTALELFFNNIQDAVKVSGLTYLHPTEDLEVCLGRQCQHQAQYKIASSKSQLGTILFTRGKRFLEGELALLEMFISVLFYPLRNALLYREALENSMRDTLTGIGNRAAMELSYAREIKLAHRHEQPLSLLLIDIDHFKQINDNLGHTNGDKVLKHVVHCIRESLRETDQIFRFGGEEFVVLLHGTDQESGRLTAERIRMKVAMTPIFIRDEEQFCSISLGISQLLQTDTTDSLFERADKALYQAKRTGRNKVVTASLTQQESSAS